MPHIETIVNKVKALPEVSFFMNGENQQ